MRHFFSLFLALLITASAHAEIEPVTKTMRFKVHEKEYSFSNYFEFNNDEAPLGVVVKKRFAHLHLRSHFEVYDPKGEWEATGVVRLLTLGSLSAALTEIDIYNTKGKKIGMIDGQLATMATARFSIYEYDETGKYTLKAIAYMDKERNGFTFTDPKNDKVIFARYRRVLLPNVRDHWECQIFVPDAVKWSVMRVFAAFAVDQQEYFRPDT